MEILIVIIKVVAMVFVGDFITGLVHFILDQYAGPNTPIIGKLVFEKNARHHHHPRQIVEKSYFDLTATSWLFGVILLATSYFVFKQIHWEVAFMLAYGANANVIHKWTHRTTAENGKLISFFQKMKFIQSRRHHGIHHRAPFDVNYCILTDLLNPILRKVRFWESTIFILSKVGIKPQN